MAGFTLHRDFSAHGFDTLLGDGEPDAGVDDGESDIGMGGRVIRVDHAKGDGALIGVRKGVAEEIEEPVVEASGIAQQGGRQVGGELGREGERLGCGAGGNKSTTVRSEAAGSNAMR